MQNDADLDNLLRQGPSLNDETQTPSIVADIDAQSQFIPGLLYQLK